MKTLVSLLIVCVFLLCSGLPIGAEEQESWEKYQSLRKEKEKSTLVPKAAKPKLIPKDIIIEQLSKPPQPTAPAPGTVPGQGQAPVGAPQFSLPPGAVPPAQLPVQPGAVIFTSDAILFDYGSAEIREGSVPQLMIIAEALRDPALANIPFFFVDGHTCDIGSDSNNCRLSWERARSVVNFLLQFGVPPQRLVARGFGERDPLYPNMTDAIRSLNRRVVLKSGTVVLPRDAALICREWGTWGQYQQQYPGPGYPPYPYSGSYSGSSGEVTVTVEDPKPATSTDTPTSLDDKVGKAFKKSAVPGTGTTVQPQAVPTPPPAGSGGVPRGFKKMELK